MAKPMTREHLNKINNAYFERNQLVLALTRFFPSFIKEPEFLIHGRLFILKGNERKYK